MTDHEDFDYRKTDISFFFDEDNVPLKNNTALILMLKRDLPPEDEQP